MQCASKDVTFLKKFNTSECKLARCQGKNVTSLCKNVTFLCSKMTKGRVRYLIVSFPGLCRLSYYNYVRILHLFLHIHVTPLVEYDISI